MLQIILKNTPKKRGFTLLETVVAAIAFSIICIAAISILSISSYMAANEYSSNKTSQEAELLLHYLVMDVKSSDSVYTDSDTLIFYRLDGEAVSYTIDNDHCVVMREEDEIIKDYTMFEIVPIDSTSFTLTLGLNETDIIEYTFSCPVLEAA